MEILHIVSVSSLDIRFAKNTNKKGIDEFQLKFYNFQACIESPWRQRIVYPATSCRLILVVIDIHESCVGGLHHERPGGYRVDLVIVKRE